MEQRPGGSPAKRVPWRDLVTAFYGEQDETKQVPFIESCLYRYEQGKM
jgi:hypothetical protein